MKIVVQESHEGEFAGLSMDEFVVKLEKGIEALRHNSSECHSEDLTKGTTKFFGEVAVIRDLAEVLTSGFEARLKVLREDIVHAVKESGV